jgi:hypothetical protein
VTVDLPLCDDDGPYLNRIWWNMPIAFVLSHVWIATSFVRRRVRHDHFFSDFWNDDHDDADHDDDDDDAD